MMFLERSSWETQTSCIETDVMSGQTATARVEAPSPVPIAAIDGCVTTYVASVMSRGGNIEAIPSLPTQKTV